MAKNMIDLNEDQVFYLKKELKKRGRKTTNVKVVEYAIEFTFNSLNILDEESIEIVEPKMKK